MCSRLQHVVDYDDKWVIQRPLYYHEKILNLFYNIIKYFDKLFKKLNKLKGMLKNWYIKFSLNKLDLTIMILTVIKVSDFKRKENDKK